MAKRLSELYGMDIYSAKGAYLGKTEDIILNLEKGEVMRLSLRPFKGGVLPGDEVKKILQYESIAYSDVIEVGDIVLVQKGPAAPKQPAK
ncbi:PRC-barrel domain protein [uncultured archaeon]|nr:PRC-barrel domain protein [uncultured archaeon]